MRLTISLLAIAAFVRGYNVTNVTLPLDSAIVLLKKDVLLPRGISHRTSRLRNPGATSTEETKSALLERKSVLISRNYTSRVNGSPQILRLELTNTVIVESINNLATFPVLSIDYGSRYIGLSIHHMGKSKLVRSIYNTGDLEHLCGAIYSVVTDNIHPPSRFIVLIGLPYSREEITGAECISQTLYNLDFATRLSRYMHRRHLEAYGNWEHNFNHKNGKPMSKRHLLHNRCIVCSLGLGCCAYNKACEEVFVIEPSDYSSTAVIGVSEESSTYQTQIFGEENRRKLDCLASDIIFRNLQEALNSDTNHRKPFLVLPSGNNLLRTHSRRDCLLLSKTIFEKCVTSLN
ncbi:alpha beta hydrolase, putative [Babesia ovata]|uniref:Alpha beta hydrolase, putative n=1 Tax=Babesia ovata TaxID=189622 RepID=A0A2H6KI70_9APIC|nr:alpha beta hydrolase, putative [Babesia ovata]GBE62688.1 alpha beta hydrolase, putative [Babesia ovata]